MSKWLVAVCMGLMASAPVHAQATKPATTRAVTQEDLERDFAQTLSGATLVGKFSEEDKGRPDAGAPREDRYTLIKVQKLYGDNWLFVVQFADKVEPVPILLPVKWAGDTPVITFTDAKIPGLGTYTARVLFYRDGYAGTWSGGDHGGNLWGKIERARPATQPSK